MLLTRYSVPVAILTQVIVQGTLVIYLPTKYITGLDLGKALRFCLNPVVILAYGLMTVPLWWSAQILYRAFGQHYWTYSIAMALLMRLLMVGIGYAVTRQVPTGREILALMMVLGAALLAKS